MTFTEIRTEAMSRLNLSSADAQTRIGSYINQRYRRLTSSLGLSTSRRTTVTENTVAGTDTLTFDLEKLELVYILESGRRRVLKEIPYEDFRTKVVDHALSGIPDEYTVTEVSSNSTTVGLYPNPSAIIAILADGLDNAATLSGSDVPNFPADFHDILILGAMADELFKMEKHPLAKDFQMQFEQRVSDLRMFLAKSAFLSPTETTNPGGIPSMTWTRYRRSS
jgi:hypothetical protein